MGPGNRKQPCILLERKANNLRPEFYNMLGLPVSRLPASMYRSPGRRWLCWWWNTGELAALGDCGAEGSTSAPARREQLRQREEVGTQQAEHTGGRLPPWAY